jgi:hypothetical protein
MLPMQKYFVTNKSSLTNTRNIKCKQMLHQSKEIISHSLQEEHMSMLIFVFYKKGDYVKLQISQAILLNPKYKKS